MSTSWLNHLLWACSRPCRVKVGHVAVCAYVFCAFQSRSSLTARPIVKVVGPAGKVPLGSTAVLACVVESGYNASVRWSRSDGSPLPPGASVQGTLLLLADIQAQHSGSYVCTFDGSAGPISEAFTLYVSGRVAFRGLP